MGVLFLIISIGLFGWVFYLIVTIPSVVRFIKAIMSKATDYGKGEVDSGHDTVDVEGKQDRNG